ncbi:MAG: heavy-metal-associated domain-containing protein [Lewinellaceae bacterium]|nr:heavy-metal-associated domain-containing protein [Phaeodactylibacter sp.]MCB9041195.1 heavy-metal-associated domain-containing protein [Lewinellaceae bacterium]
MKKLMFVLTFLLFGWAAQQATAQTQIATTESNTQTAKFKVTGMTCSGCANHISQALQKLDGVVSEDVEFPGDVAVVTYEPKKVKEKAIIAAIEGAGYKAKVLKEEKPDKKSGS